MQKGQAVILYQIGNQKNKDKIEKNNIYQIKIDGRNWKQKFFLENNKKIKIKIKRIKTEFETSSTKRNKLSF